MELAEIEPDEIVLFTGDPAARMQQMAETAAIIAEPVRATTHRHHQRPEHVRVEGWTMLGALLGVHPYLVWSTADDNQDDRGTAGKPGSKPAPAPAKSSAQPKPCAPATRKPGQAATTTPSAQWPKPGPPESPAPTPRLRHHPRRLRPHTRRRNAQPATFKAPAASGGLPITEPQTEKDLPAPGQARPRPGCSPSKSSTNPCCKLYGTSRVNELNREQARELIDRLEAVEPT